MKIFLFLILIPFAVMAEAEKEKVLSLEQRGQIIWAGSFASEDGFIYDYAACPGYKTPTLYTWKNWKRGGHEFKEYFKVKGCYYDLYEFSEKSLTWAYKDCLWDGIVIGIPDVWSENFSDTDNWWDYPEATLKSLLDNLFRVPVKLLGTTLGTVSGVGLGPAYYMVKPTINTTFYCVVPGSFATTFGYTWNTIYTLPHAMICRYPSESDINGFTLRKYTIEEFAIKQEDQEEITDEDVKQLAEWGKTLSKKLKRYKIQRQKNTDSRKDRQLEIEKEIERDNAMLKAIEREEYRQMLKQPEVREKLKQLLQKKFTATRIDNNSEKLWEYLLEESSDTTKVLDIIDLLKEYEISEIEELMSEKESGTKNKK